MRLCASSRYLGNMIDVSSVSIWPADSTMSPRIAKVVTISDNSRNTTLGLQGPP
jgi:hypothetical protein